MPTRAKAAWWILGLALAWVALVVVAPLASLIDAALPWSLSAAERQALVRSAIRGMGLAIVVASAATVVATLLARTISPVVLLVLLLLGRFVVAHGVLALGVAPGAVAAGFTLIADVAPFAAMIVLLRLRTRPRALLEAAADLGAGPLERARRVDWPHLRPALLTAWVWALLQALGDVIAFEIAGGGHSYTLGLLIRDALLREAAPGRALVAVVFVLALALVCAGLIARELSSAEQTGFRPSSPAPIGLRVLGWLSLAALLFGPMALLTGPQPVGWEALDARLAELLGQTAAIAAVVAGLAGALGFGLAIATRERGPRSFTLPITVALLAPLAIPPSVLGLLSLTAATRVGWPPGLALTVVTLLGPGLALGFVTARVLISTIPPALLDAAADLGADGRARLRLVWLPLGRPALIAAAAVVFAWVLAQAAIPAFTSGPGGDTLAVALTVYARAGAMAVVRRWSLIAVFVALACVVLIERSTRGRRRT